MNFSTTGAAVGRSLRERRLLSPSHGKKYLHSAVLPLPSDFVLPPITWIEIVGDLLALAAVAVPLLIRLNGTTTRWERITWR
jgi:hypothetical protein